MSNITAAEYIQAAYLAQVSELDKLHKTPQIVRDTALDTIRRIKSLDKLPPNERRAYENGVEALKNISDASMSDSFATIYAQLCVLIVSALEASLKELFARHITSKEMLRRDSEALKKIKLSFSEIVELGSDIEERLGDIVLAKQNNSFQDLKSIKRTFGDFFNIDTERLLGDRQEKFAIFYFECRHIIVHSGGIVNQKFLDAVLSKDANLKGFSLGDKVLLGEKDWENMKEAFWILLQELVTLMSQDGPLRLSDESPNAEPAAL